MPSISVPVYPGMLRSPVTHPESSTARMRSMGEPTGMVLRQGSNTGVPVTDAQVILDFNNGKLQHGSQYRYNRYTKRWLDYDKLRAMRRDPTIALARDAAVAPIIGSTWTLEFVDSNAPEWLKEYADKYLHIYRIKFLRTALYGEIDFGWRAYEKVLNSVKDKKLGVKVIPQRIKPLLNDRTWARYNSEGDFDGLLHQDINSNEWFAIKAEYSLFANFDDDGLGNYNDPRLIRAENAYDEWLAANDAAKRFDQKVAGAVWVIHYPEGRSKYRGELTDHADIARDVAYQIKASGHIIIPSKLLAAAQQELDELGQPGWKIELLESGDKQAAFTTRLDYLDKLKIRAMGVLERAIAEGNYGTKAEAESHINLMLLNQQLKHADLTEFYNQQIVDQFTAINVNDVGIIKYVAQPLTDARKELYATLINGLLTHPDPTVASEVTSSIDIKELLHAAQVPVLSDEQLNVNEQSISSLFTLVNQAIVNESQTQQVTQQPVAQVQGTEIQQTLASDFEPLNGAQIEAASNLLQQVSLGVLPGEAVVSLLEALGLPLDKAKVMVNAAVAKASEVQQQVAQGNLEIK